MRYYLFALKKIHNFNFNKLPYFTLVKSSKIKNLKKVTDSLIN